MSIFRNTAVVTIMSLGVSVISFLNQLILAKYFGAGASMDIYLTLSSIPFMISGLIVAALSYSLTPHLILEKAILKEEFNGYVSNLFRRMIRYSFVISITGCLVLILSKRIIYPAGIWKSNEGNWIIISSWLTMFIGIPVGFITCYANSLSKFKFPLLVTFFPYLFSIIFVVALHNYLGIIAVALGLLTGFLISLALFLIFFRRQAVFSVRPIAVAASLEKRTFVFLKAMPVIMLAMLCFSIYQSIDAYWASKLGNAAVSYLGYCQRIIVAMATLVIIGPSTVIIPRLTRAISEERRPDFYSDTAILIKMIISIASILSLIGALLATEIIELMFERGAFKKIDTINLAALLPYMLTGIVFAACVVMMFRAFFVINNIKAVAWLGVTCAVVYFVLCGVGSRVIGLRGIGAAYAVTWVIIFMLAIHVLFKNNFKYILNSQNLRFIIYQLLLLLITGLAIIYSKPIFESWVSAYSGPVKVSMVLVLSAGLGLLTYLVLAMKVLRQPELAFLIRGFTRKKTIISEAF